VAFCACADVSTDDGTGDVASTSSEKQQETDMQQAQTIYRSASLPPSAADETCTETDGACKVGQCELGPHDTFMPITEVCCTPSGSCTTEHYRLCGC
jgi:hypothetical protein